LQFLVDHFLSFPVMSVQLACENYFLQFTSSNTTEAKEYVLEFFFFVGRELRFVNNIIFKTEPKFSD
jgi:hypothetical protein